MRNLAPRQRQALHYAPAMLTPCIVSTRFGALAATLLDGIGIDSNGAGLGEADAQRLASYRLAVPVVGVTKQNLRDTYNERRGSRPHEELDIPAARGTHA